MSDLEKYFYTLYHQQRLQDTPMGFGDDPLLHDWARPEPRREDFITQHMPRHSPMEQVLFHEELGNPLTQGLDEMPPEVGYPETLSEPYVPRFARPEPVREPEEPSRFFGIGEYGVGLSPFRISAPGPHQVLDTISRLAPEVPEDVEPTIQTPTPLPEHLPPHVRGEPEPADIHDVFPAYPRKREERRHTLPPHVAGEEHGGSIRDLLGISREDEEPELPSYMDRKIHPSEEGPRDIVGEAGLSVPREYELPPHVGEPDAAFPTLRPDERDPDIVSRAAAPTREGEIRAYSPSMLPLGRRTARNIEHVRDVGRNLLQQAASGMAGEVGAHHVVSWLFTPPEEETEPPRTYIEEGVEYEYEDGPPDLAPKITAEDFLKEPETLGDEVAQVVGAITPYVMSGGIFSGPVAARTGSILGKYAPRLAKGFAGRIVPQVTGGASLGGSISAIREATGWLDEPEEKSLRESLQNVVTDAGRFATWRLAQGVIATPLQRKIMTALPQALNEGRLTPALVEVLSTGITGGLAGSSMAAVEAFFQYLNDPEEFEVAQAANDILTQGLFFGGMSIAFSLLGMAQGRRPALGRIMRGREESNRVKQRLIDAGGVETQPGVIKFAKGHRLSGDDAYYGRGWWAEQQEYSRGRPTGNIKWVHVSPIKDIKAKGPWGIMPQSRVLDSERGARSFFVAKLPGDRTRPEGAVGRAESTEYARVLSFLSQEGWRNRALMMLSRGLGIERGWVPTYAQRLDPKLADLSSGRPVPEYGMPETKGLWGVPWSRKAANRIKELFSEGLRIARRQTKGEAHAKKYGERVPTHEEARGVTDPYQRPGDPFTRVRDPYTAPTQVERQAAPEFMTQPGRYITLQDGRVIDLGTGQVTTRPSPTVQHGQLLRGFLDPSPERATGLIRPRAAAPEQISFPGAPHTETEYMNPIEDLGMEPEELTQKEFIDATRDRYHRAGEELSPEDIEELKTSHRQSVEEALETGKPARTDDYPDLVSDPALLEERADVDRRDQERADAVDRGETPTQVSVVESKVGPGWTVVEEDSGVPLMDFANQEAADAYANRLNRGEDGYEDTREIQGAEQYEALLIAAEREHQRKEAEQQRAEQHTEPLGTLDTVEKTGEERIISVDSLAYEEEDLLDEEGMVITAEDSGDALEFIGVRYAEAEQAFEYNPNNIDRQKEIVEEASKAAYSVWQGEEPDLDALDKDTRTYYDRFYATEVTEESLINYGANVSSILDVLGRSTPHSTPVDKTAVQPPSKQETTQAETELKNTTQQHTRKRGTTDTAKDQTPHKYSPGDIQPGVYVYDAAGGKLHGAGKMMVKGEEGNLLFVEDEQGNEFYVNRKEVTTTSPHSHRRQPGAWGSQYKHEDRKDEYQDNPQAPGSHHERAPLTEKDRAFMDKLKASLRTHSISPDEKAFILGYSERFLRSARTAGIDVDFSLDLATRLTDQLTTTALQAHGLEPGTEAYADGKVMVQSDGTLLKVAIELATDVENPISPTLLHEMAHVWNILWEHSNKEEFTAAVDYFAEKTYLNNQGEKKKLGRRRAREHLAEILADAAMAGIGRDTLAPSFLRRIVGKFQEWADRVFKRLLKFKEQVFPNLPDVVKDQCQAFADGDWERAFRGVHSNTIKKNTYFNMESDWAAPFHSRLRTQLLKETKGQQKFTKKQLKKLIYSGKKDEVYWSGIIPWVEAQQEPIHLDDVLAQIRDVSLVEVYGAERFGDVPLGEQFLPGDREHTPEGVIDFIFEQDRRCTDTLTKLLSDIERGLRGYEEPLSTEDRIRLSNQVADKMERLSDFLPQNVPEDLNSLIKLIDQLIEEFEEAEDDFVNVLLQMYREVQETDKRLRRIRRALRTFSPPRHSRNYSESGVDLLRQSTKYSDEEIRRHLPYSLETLFEFIAGLHLTDRVAEMVSNIETYKSIVETLPVAQFDIQMLLEIGDRIEQGLEDFAVQADLAALQEDITKILDALKLTGIYRGSDLDDHYDELRSSFGFLRDRVQDVADDRNSAEFNRVSDSYLQEVVDKARAQLWSPYMGLPSDTAYQQGKKEVDDRVEWWDQEIGWLKEIVDQKETFLNDIQTHASELRRYLTRVHNEGIFGTQEDLDAPQFRSKYDNPEYRHPYGIGIPGSYREVLFSPPFGDWKEAELDRLLSAKDVQELLTVHPRPIDFRLKWGELVIQAIPGENRTMWGIYAVGEDQSELVVEPQPSPLKAFLSLYQQEIDRDEYAVMGKDALLNSIMTRSTLVAQKFLDEFAGGDYILLNHAPNRYNRAEGDRQDLHLVSASDQGRSITGGFTAEKTIRQALRKTGDLRLAKVLEQLEQYTHHPTQHFEGVEDETGGGEIAFMRYDIVEGEAAGEKYLRIQEFQSDWHQNAREYGYRMYSVPDNWKFTQEEMPVFLDNVLDKIPPGAARDRPQLHEEIVKSAVESKDMIYLIDHSKVPDERHEIRIPDLDDLTFTGRDTMTLVRKMLADSRFLNNYTSLAKFFGYMEGAKRAITIEDLNAHVQREGESLQLGLPYLRFFGITRPAETVVGLGDFVNSLLLESHINTVHRALQILEEGIDFRPERSNTEDRAVQEFLKFVDERFDEVSAELGDTKAAHLRSVKSTLLGIQSILEQGDRVRLTEPAEGRLMTVPFHRFKHVSDVLGMGEAEKWLFTEDSAELISPALEALGIHIAPGRLRIPINFNQEHIREKLKPEIEAAVQAFFNPELEENLSEFARKYLRRIKLYEISHRISGGEEDRIMNNWLDLPQAFLEGIAVNLDLMLREGRDDAAPEKITTENVWVLRDEKNNIQGMSFITDEGKAKAAIMDSLSAREKVPPAPFSTNWYEYMFKWALRKAAEKGLQGVVWSPGKVQAERWSMFRVIDTITWKTTYPSAKDRNKEVKDLVMAHQSLNPLDWVPEPVYHFALFKDGVEISPRAGAEVEDVHGLLSFVVPESDLAGKFGKALADQIKEKERSAVPDLEEASALKRGHHRKLTLDKDMQVGRGHGMVQAYGEFDAEGNYVPGIMFKWLQDSKGKRYLKQWDAQLETLYFREGEGSGLKSNTLRRLYGKLLKSPETIPVPGVKITQDMQNDVLYKGQTNYSLRGGDGNENSIDHILQMYEEYVEQEEIQGRSKPRPRLSKEERAQLAKQEILNNEEKAKEIGFKNLEEARLVLEANEMGRQRWITKSEEIPTGTLRKYVRLESPESMYNQLVDRLKEMDPEKVKDLAEGVKYRGRTKFEPEQEQEINKRRKRIKKLLKKRLRPEFEGVVKDLLREWDWKVNYRTEKKIKALEGRRDFLKRNPDAYMPDNKLKELELLDKRPLTDATFDEIMNLFDVVEQYYRLNALKNQLTIGKDLRNVKKEIEEIKQDIRAALPELKGFDAIASEMDTTIMSKEGPGVTRASLVEKLYTTDSFMPEFLTQFLQGKESGKLSDYLYHAIDDGFNKKYDIWFRIMEDVREAIGTTNIKPWSRLFNKREKGLEVLEITNPSTGKKFKLTKGERMAIYLHSKNEYNRRNLIEGGFRVAHNRSQIVKLSEDDVKHIVSEMTERETQIADALSAQLHYLRDELNEVSVKLIGHEVARVENYFPIHRDRDDVKKDRTADLRSVSFTHRMLERMGILQTREDVVKPIILRDAFDSFLVYVQDASSYAAFAEPVRNARMILDDVEFKKMLEAAGKRHYHEALEAYLGDIEGHISNLSNLDKLSLKLLNPIHVSILGLNVAVMFKQPTSYLAAGTEIGTNYLRKALFTRVDWSEIYQHDSQLRYRDQGKITREMGEIGEVGHHLNFFLGEELVSQKWTKGIRMMDRLTVGRIWNAVKLETEDLHPELTSEEFWEHVADRTRKIVNRTQPTYLPHTRSAWGRNPHPLVRVMSPFHTQRNKNFNIIVREVWKYRKSKKTPKDKARLMKSMFLMLVAVPIYLLGVDEARDRALKRDPKQDVVTRAVKLVGINLGNLYVLGGAYDSIVSNLERGRGRGFDMVDPLTQTTWEGIDAIVDMLVLIESVITQEEFKDGAKEGEKAWMTNLMSFIDSAGVFMGKYYGVPYQNIRVQGEGILKQIGGPDAEIAVDALTRNPQQAYYYNQVWDRLEAGRTEDAKRAMYILHDYFDVKTDDLKRSWSSRKEDGRFDAEDWRRARELYIEVRRERATY